MNIRALFFLTFALAVGLVAAAAEDHKLSKTEGLPKGLSEKVAAQLNPTGFRVSGPDGALLDLWLAKAIDVKADFNAQLMVKYPFNPGQLIGAIRVPEASKFKDFRGQEMEAGTYTLRYGQQPVDGNHIGTSETSDFLLAIPAKADTDPKPIAIADRLHQQSAKSVSSTHPAILYLLPAEEKAPEKPTLVHDANQEYWIVNLAAAGLAEDKDVKVPMRVVVVGQALE